MEQIFWKTWNSHYSVQIWYNYSIFHSHKTYNRRTISEWIIQFWFTVCNCVQLCAPLCIAIMAYTAHLNSKWQVLIGLQKWTFYHSISPQRNIFADRRLYESIKLSTEVRLLNEILAGNPCFCFQNCPNFDPKYTNWIIKARIFCFFSSCSFALK